MKQNTKLVDPPAWVQALITICGCLVGIAAAELLFVPGNLLHPPTIADEVRDYGCRVIGAIVGGLFFSWASRR
jgi:hypothetical protein